MDLPATLLVMQALSRQPTSLPIDRPRQPADNYLDKLPLDLVFLILKHVNAQSIKCLTSTAHKFYKLRKEPRFPTLLLNAFFKTPAQRKYIPNCHWNSFAFSGLYTAEKVNGILVDRVSVRRFDGVNVLDLDMALLGFIYGSFLEATINDYHQLHLSCSGLKHGETDFDKQGHYFLGIDLSTRTLIHPLLLVNSSGSFKFCTIDQKSILVFTETIGQKNYFIIKCYAANQLNHWEPLEIPYEYSSYSLVAVHFHNQHIIGLFEGFLVKWDGTNKPSFLSFSRREYNRKMIPIEKYIFSFEPLPSSLVKCSAFTFDTLEMIGVQTISGIYGLPKQVFANHVPGVSLEFTIGGESFFWDFRKVPRK